MTTTVVRLGLYLVLHIHTVKPELTATSEYWHWPPAYKGHHLKGPIFFFLIKATSEQRPPVNNSLNFRVPRVDVVYRFDCISINFGYASIMKTIESKLNQWNITLNISLYNITENYCLFGTQQTYLLKKQSFTEKFIKKN